MDKVLARDINNFKASFPFRDELRGASFLITGATGLIGSTLIRCLAALNEGIHIIAPVRNLAKAKMLFGENFPGVDFMECNIMDIVDGAFGDVDYIVHGAAPTASRFFVENPVETIDTIFNGTKAVLDYARSYQVKGMVNLSSLEVYGTILDDSAPVSENVQGYLDPLSVRSSYPMAKRAAENLCVAYAKEYGVHVKTARLTQTTGAGIAKDDNRIIAQFARLAAKGEDIVLHTKGDSARPYCYTIDSINAILYVLLKGTDGDAYNVANEETYISARGMAEYLQKNFNPSIKVRVELGDNYGYAPATKLRLSAAKLGGLGWKPRYGLKEIFENLIEYLKA
jgi:UDP-glucuronate decarboxylase